MEQDMKEIGEMEWLKDKALFIMPMEMFILESFIKIKQMDSVYIFIRMDRSMKAFGKMTSKKDLVEKN
jgi:hypothetical protein